MVLRSCLREDDPKQTPFWVRYKLIILRMVHPLMIYIYTFLNLLIAHIVCLTHISIAAVILGGGAGTRLYPLTKNRAKPAVPIGGAYRLIDVPMSNCINSGLR